MSAFQDAEQQGDAIVSDSKPILARRRLLGTPWIKYSENEGPRESRTAQFYQAHADATNPLKAKYEADAKKAKYHLALGHISQDNPDPTPRLKIRLGEFGHTISTQRLGGAGTQ